MTDFAEPDDAGPNDDTTPEERAAIAVVIEKLQGRTMNDRIRLLTYLLCLTVRNADFPAEGGERLISRIIEFLPAQYQETKRLLAKLAREGESYG
jgi:hypothetical protein